MLRILIRADANAAIGGGHVMRCLSLARAAVLAGHQVTFATSDMPLQLRQKIRACGAAILEMGAPETSIEPQGQQHWRPFGIEEDARRLTDAVKLSDWLILDHYGLDGQWVRAVRAAAPDTRIAAMADLDEGPYFADLLLDYAHVTPRKRAHPHLALMGGAHDALLRPDFRELRPKALQRRESFSNRLLILPGMMDAAGLAPSVLDALGAYSDWTIEVIMGGQSQSRASVEKRVAANSNCH